MRIEKEIREQLEELKRQRIDEGSFIESARAEHRLVRSEIGARVGSQRSRKSLILLGVSSYPCIIAEKGKNFIRIDYGGRG